MNEKHALNLEKLVAQRSAELAQAREETERLLHEMLPPSIAIQLKEQKAVEPRSYDCATVLFCQLVDFSTVIENGRRKAYLLLHMFTGVEQIPAQPSH